VIVVARTSQVTHKVVDLEPKCRPPISSRPRTTSNAEFSGLSLAEVRERILERLSQERVLYDRINGARAPPGPDQFRLGRDGHSLFVEGASSLVDEVAAPYSGVTLAALGTLVRMIEEKHRLVRLLTEYIDGPG